MYKLFSVLIFALVLTGCVVIPSDVFHSRGGEVQSMQLRTIEFSNKEKLVAAIVGVLQDVGYKVGETSFELGVVKATKEADARRGEELALNIASALLVGRVNSVDDNQKITASVVVYSRDIPDIYDVRAVFVQEVYKTDGFKSKAASIEDEQIYSVFFDKLSKSIFIEENEI